MFKSVSSKVNFPELEESILEFWQREGILKQYLARNEDSEKRYSFIDGPITANNPMGVHHAWGRTYKDMFTRFRTMQGYKQRYQNGFDGQGLWIEVEVEKELGFKSKRDIEKFGVGEFVELCKERVRHFSDVITKQSIRLGYWMDWDNSYHTMSDDNNYSIWKFIKTCFEKGLLYQGTDVMPWCPRCSTGLSEHEIVTEGYHDTVHPGLFVKFPLTDRGGDFKSPQEYFLIWTTTPWTLTSNSAVAVNPQFVYVKVKQEGQYLYLAKERLSCLKGDYSPVAEFKGADLVGLKYKGPFDELPAQNGVVHTVVQWEEVSESEGTGIVHIAPGAGKEDFALGKTHGLATIAPLDDHGNFLEGFAWLTGKNVYEVAEPIIKNLKSKQLFYHVDQYTHRYPHCWRCSSELVFRLVDEWFISMDPLREPISEATRNIEWIPQFGMKRELDWLNNMDDWMISKKRYYGLALPIYKCGCGNFDVVGSKDELKQKAIEGWDLYENHSPHRPWIDAVKIRCSKCGEAVSRIAEVGNPWLDAGVVPFSTMKYEKDEKYWEEWFPADWISESFPGQYRNWFYSLLTMSVVLAGKEPCKSIFSYALMRDEHGEEMHKSKGNAIWFEDGAKRMGVDAMRWQFARQNPAANLSFGYGTADEVRRRFIIPIWNVYSFFVTYANIDQYDPATPSPEIPARPELDRWILSELNSLVYEVTDALENFEPERSIREIEQFIEYLSNWYIRRSRRRFWKSGLLNKDVETHDTDKLSAYSTLYECLVTLAELLAPITPFMTEEIYQTLVASTGHGRASVHLEDYPLSKHETIDQNLAAKTRMAMRLSSMGRSARSKAGIRVRQPLDRLLVKTKSATEHRSLIEISSQLMDELNVKEIHPVDEIHDLMDVQIQPQYSVIGPKYGTESQNIRRAIDNANPSEILRQLSAHDSAQLGRYSLVDEDIQITLTDKEGLSVAKDGDYAVAVTTTVSDQLASEGLAREIIHRVQNMRRSSGLEITDRIDLWYRGDLRVSTVFKDHRDYIREELLSEELSEKTAPQGAYAEEHIVDGLTFSISIRKHPE